MKQVYELYDEYCHGGIDRREFFKRAAALGAAGLAMAYGLLPDYARAQTISFTDSRIKAQYVTYPSPGGNAETMRGYLVQPAGQGPWPAVLVIHENRGLNPYIEDVARRAAVEGFIALAPDGLAPFGGYPGNDDDGRALQSKLDQAKLRTDMLNGARFMKSHKLSNGRLGATGFCSGGGTANWLAVTLGADLQAAVPFYGVAVETSSVPKIKAADPRASRRERPARERDVSGLRAGAQASGRAPRDPRLPGDATRLPQRLDAALQRGGRQARVAAHRRFL